MSCDEREQAAKATHATSQSEVSQPKLKHAIRDESDMLPCVHRGERTDDIECGTCRNNTRFKAYKCEKHELCAFAKKAEPQAKYCFECHDRVAG